MSNEPAQPPSEPASDSPASQPAATDAAAARVLTGAPVPPELAAVVLAWQHRHPLARRLKPEDVGLAGLVALPFQPRGAAPTVPAHAPEPAPAPPAAPVRTDPILADLPEAPRPSQPEATPAEEAPPAQAPSTAAAPPATGWRRWLAALRRPPKVATAPLADPAFADEGLIAGLSHRQVQRFARRHAFELPPGEPDWPVRRVASAAGGGEPAALRYLMTVAVKGPGGEAQRLLIGQGERRWRGWRLPPVLGRRQLSRRRVVVAGLLVLLLASATVGGVVWWQRHQHQVQQAAAQALAASQAAAAASAAQAASAASAAAAMAAAEAASVASAAAAASAADGAQAASEPATEHHAAPDTSASAPVGRGPVVAHAADPGSVTPPPQALVSQPQASLRQAQALRQRLRQALGPEGEHLQLEVMDSPQGPVVTLWPVPAAAAPGLAASFTQAGVVMRVVDF